MSESLKFEPLCISAWNVCSAIGDDRERMLSAVRKRQSGLRRNDYGKQPLSTWIGRVANLETDSLPNDLRYWDCRNNRLAWRGLQGNGFLEAVVKARERYGAHRVAVIVGTSTASIGATEEAYSNLDEQGQFPIALRRPIVHSLHSLADFVQHALKLENISVTVATACSSSAKVFGHAERLLRLGIADAAVIGGVDTLCGSVLYGFNSLELISPDPCRPFDVHRRGISLGEAAGFALLEREGEGTWFIGFGESSDAHHMSSPHPEGRGARIAIAAALKTAAIESRQVDYINLHGTASQKNDEVEAKLVADLFPESAFASSTKGWTGHTLGAAGIVEAGMCLLALECGELPGTLNSEVLDGLCGPQIRLANEHRRADHALSFSFGFGGSNCVLAFAKSRSV